MRLPPEQFPWMPLKVCSAELVPHLVGDVVDRVEVTDRVRETGATRRLVDTADDAGEGDAAAVVAQRDVADVVVGRADQLAQDDLVARQRAHVTVGQLALDVVGGVGVQGVAGVRAARTVRPGRLLDGVEIELLGPVDEHHPDRQVVVVDLVDAGHQGDLLGQHVLGAEVVGVRRVAQQRQPVDPLHHRGAGRRRCRRTLRLDGPRDGGQLPFDRRARGLRKAAAVVDEVLGGAALVVRRVDEPGVLAVGATHRRVEAHGGDVEGDGRAAVVERHTRPGLQLAVRSCELRLHHRGALDGEAFGVAGRGGQLEHGRPGRADRRSAGELGPHVPRVDPHGRVPSGIDPDLRPGGLEAPKRRECAAGRLGVSRRKRKGQAGRSQRGGDDGGGGEPDSARQWGLPSKSASEWSRISHSRRHFPRWLDPMLR